MIIPITNQSKNFYSHLGKVFGSREVERKTGDRFYDDDNKVWYLYYDKGVPNTFISVSNNIIKNVWSENETHLIEVLQNIRPKICLSLVPRYFKECYVKAGYEIIENGTKNFIKIRGGYVEED